MTHINATRVLVVDLDVGQVLLADRAGVIGIDTPLAAVLSWGAIDATSAGLTLERQAMPEHVQSAWWINRAATIYECEAGAGGVFAGRVLFSGIVAAQPSESAGVWSLQLAPPRRRVRPVPDLGIVTSTDWPTAAESVAGAVLPEVYGSVTGCPLLPVALPAATTLSADALPDDGQLEVSDAADLPASGTVWVDGRSYTYSARSDVALLGVDVTAAHRQGTAVVLDGDTVFLAAGHAVTAIDTLRSDGQPVAGATTDLAAATVTFAEPPLVLDRAERFTLTEHFDSIATGTTALNGVNAIRAVTASPSQSATSLPSAVTAATAGAVIQFARPSGGRIVAGAYSVSFTVSVGTQVGWARIRIGREVVWAYEPPGPALYEFNPASFLFDDDTDVLPVVVEVADGGSTDQVSVTVTAASRVVGVGNLDDANFATLRSPSNLLWRAEQSTTPVDRGSIVKASLWVRWFANGSAAMPTVAVSFDGRSLGSLAQTALSNSSLSQIVSVNSVTQGAAALPQQNIGSLISGGTASLSHTTIAQSVTIPAAFSYPFISGTLVRRGFSLAPVLTGWSSGLGNITCKLQVQSVGTPSDPFKWVDIRRSNGTTILQMVASGGTWTEVATNIWEQSATISESPYDLYWVENNAGDGRSMVSITLQYNAQPTAVAQTFSSTGVSASPITAQSLNNSGIDVALANNAISFTVPAPPRVQDSLFALSWISDWADLQGMVEISAASGGADVCINQVALLVEYDAQVHRRVESMTATVDGRDGDPAAVIARLAAASGQEINGEASRRLETWATANSMALARRIAERQDALTLLTFAAEQCGVMLAETDDGLAPVRWADLGGSLPVIAETDLMEPASIGWADRVETDITLRYREDYLDGGMTRALRASAADTRACELGEAEIADSRPVEIDGGWLRDDTSAALSLAAHVARYARPRRLLTLPCAFDVTAQAGDLIEYRPLDASAADGIVARVIERSDADGWPTLIAEEILR